MIAAINPSAKAYHDSHNTLKYANRAKAIAVQPKAKAQLSDILREVTRKEKQAQKQKTEQQQQKASKSVKTTISKGGAKGAKTNVSLSLLGCVY